MPITIIGPAVTFRPSFGVVHSQLEPGVIGGVAITRGQLPVQGRVLAVPSCRRPVLSSTREVAGCFALVGRSVTRGSFRITPRTRAIPIATGNVAILRAVHPLILYRA